MSERAVVAHKGDEIRDANGKLVCRLARDVLLGEPLALDQFTDWQGKVPREAIPPEVLAFSARTRAAAPTEVKPDGE